ncbi:MAG: hypothetical protein M5U28_15845 [Sandaracinaceae bacterium]|nr:hypothetical protein [Sandaracinaceae bacterium]
MLVVGISLPDGMLDETAVGTEPLGGTRDYRRWYAPVSMASLTADPDRRTLRRGEIVDLLLADSADPGPVGHGYPADPDLTHGANYAYDAVPGLLRILTLDTNDDTGGSNGLVHRATVDEWLVPELERAADDGVLVMLASHHATSSIDVFRGQLGSEVVPDAVPPAELEQIVASHPSAIAWLVGHSHDNRIRAVAGPDASRPGYWEIMTSAIADYPGQARLVELVDNGDGTLLRLRDAHRLRRGRLHGAPLPPAAHHGVGGRLDRRREPRAVRHERRAGGVRPEQRERRRRRGHRPRPHRERDHPARPLILT